MKQEVVGTALSVAHAPHIAVSSHADWQTFLAEECIAGLDPLGHACFVIIEHLFSLWLCNPLEYCIHRTHDHGATFKRPHDE